MATFHSKRYSGIASIYIAVAGIYTLRDYFVHHNHGHDHWYLRLVYELVDVSALVLALLSLQLMLCITALCDL